MKRSQLDIGYMPTYHKYRDNRILLPIIVLILTGVAVGVIAKAGTNIYYTYVRESHATALSLKELETKFYTLEEQTRKLELRVSETEKRLKPKWVTEGTPIRELSDQVIVSVEIMRDESQDVKFTLHVGKEKPMHFDFRDKDIPARKIFVWNQQTYFLDILEIDKAGKRVKIGIVPKLDEL